MILAQVAIKARTVFAFMKCWPIFMQTLHTRYDKPWAHISKLIRIIWTIYPIWYISYTVYDIPDGCKIILFRHQRSLIQILLLKSSSFEMMALFWSTIDEKLQLDIWESLILQVTNTDSNEIKTDLSNLTKKVWSWSNSVLK